MLKELKELLKDNKEITNLANFSAYFYHKLNDINWFGFYFIENDYLYLGPFQGNVACTKIKYGNGVCGTCFKLEKTIVVDNVLEFSGHIACDSRSKSEICIPIFKNNKMIGLLDVDSPIFNRFDSKTKEILEQAVKILEEFI